MGFLMEEFELKKNSICSNIFESILVRNEKKLAKNIQIERVYINIVFLYRIHVCSLNANVSVDLRSTVKRWRHTNIWKLRCFFLVAVSLYTRMHCALYKRIVLVSNSHEKQFKRSFWKAHEKWTFKFFRALSIFERWYIASWNQNK